MYHKIILIILCLSFIGCNIRDERLVKTGDTVFVAYRIENMSGDRLDESFLDGNFNEINDNELLSFVVGNQEVIKGWDDLIVGCKKDTLYSYKIESQYAYGDSQIYHDIPNNSELMLEFKIIDIK